MKKKRFTEAQIVSILLQQEVGKSVKGISREYGISDATFYNWKAKYGGMQVRNRVTPGRILNYSIGR